MKIESFPRKLFLFRNNLCMFAQTQNELHNMKHMSILAVSLLALVACTPEKKQEADYSQYVNPMIGTDFTGNTYPGAQVPFGMVQLSPDNGLPGWDRISGYFYPDTTIAGFSHTHLSGTGAGDLYDISFMPVTRPYKEAPAPLGIYSTFSHNDEAASAGYYRVLLKDYNINVELTANYRALRYPAVYLPGGRGFGILELEEGDELGLYLGFQDRGGRLYDDSWIPPIPRLVSLAACLFRDPFL